jgi:CRISPR-associated protein Csm1
MPDNNIILFALAGLFHDIGKIGQRGHEGDAGLSSLSIGLKDSICRKNLHGNYTHLHVLWTNEFCDLIKLNLPKGINASNLANLASYHHAPNTTEETLIKDADHLSSAMDREESEEEYTTGNFRKVLLKPVIHLIGRESAETINESWAFLPQKYAYSDIIPRLRNELPNQTERYRQIWDGLITEIKSLVIEDGIKYINTCLSLLEKYLWAVPSATNARIPDISLFDHLKTTSAIATCLYLAENKDKPFILAAGEFGGIQKYIFNLTAGIGGVAKALRGRSFLVGEVSDTTASSILHKLGLPLTHLVIMAGGKFYLILPNTKNVIKTLNEHQSRMHEWILNKRNGELRFNLTYIEVDNNGIKDFAKTMTNLGEQLYDSGLRGLDCLKSNNAWDEKNWLLKGYAGSNEELCPSCRTEKATHDWKEDKLCEVCHNDRLLGQELVKTKSVQISYDNSYNFKLPFANIGFGRNSDNADLIVQFDFLENPDKGKPYFTILKNNYVPMDENEDVMEFGDIAEKASGKKALAFLAADIDDLGFQFSMGFKNVDADNRDRRSISRVATLSRELEYFFSGYLSHFLKEKYPYTYTVFSGGDDLLFIGPWDAMFHLARDLQIEYSKFTCQNKSWGISAGIAVVGAKAPMLFSQGLAKRFLKQSKEGSEKNKVTALGKTLTWDEYSKALNQGDILAEWINDGTLNTGKIYRFLQYGRKLDDFHATGNTACLHVIPLMIYDLTRNWKDSDDNERKAKAWAHQFTNPEFPESKLLSFICQYALIKTRM